MPIPSEFVYNNNIYFLCKPVKALFKSDMVHNVITRGDVFAVNMLTNELTVIPGTAIVEPVEYDYNYKTRTLSFNLPKSVTTPDGELF